MFATLIAIQPSYHIIIMIIYLNVPFVMMSIMIYMATGV